MQKETAAMGSMIQGCMSHYLERLWRKYKAAVASHTSVHTWLGPGNSQEQAMWGAYYNGQEGGKETPATHYIG